MAPKDPQAPPAAASPHTPQHASAVHVDRPATIPKATVAAPPQEAAVVPVQPATEPVPVQDQVPQGGASTELILPLNIVSRSDIARSLREVEGLNEFFHQAAVRGGKPQDLPKLGQALESILKANGLNALKAEDRDAAKTFLTRLKAKAPVVHMSFPSEASGEFLAKLLEWFRREVHPHVVLHIGLQPDLAAGFTMRTTNKYFDFSFRRRFEKSKEKLVAALEASE